MNKVADLSFYRAKKKAKSTIELALAGMIEYNNSALANVCNHADDIYFVPPNDSKLNSGFVCADQIIHAAKVQRYQFEYSNGILIVHFDDHVYHVRLKAYVRTESLIASTKSILDTECELNYKLSEIHRSTLFS